MNAAAEVAMFRPRHLPTAAVQIPLQRDLLARMAVLRRFAGRLGDV